MMTSTVEDLLSEGQLGAEKLELPSGRTVEVRGLTLAEVRTALKADDSDAEFIAYGLVSPVLTAEQVALWVQRASAGDVAATANRVKELSGLIDDTKSGGAA